MPNADLDLILRKEVEKIFGKSVKDKRDSELLSDRISEEIREQISSQTIRRFWKLIQNGSNISPQTKDIFCRYIGFNDFKAFAENVQNNRVNTYDFSFLGNWQTISKYDKPL
ncbi:hypothetical protein [Capnocytophaga sp. H2931]|uniref:hypothetical protein n=1 Tax=Capnocytophaga sp. H2931 TaxID=1945657 RepID=UPI000BB1C12E|nr:hypothetical protein [Capnocytophaga sp. H2931]ATA75167.1 hypothetical protein CGC52_06930 [Capnocytophaga sp. H2931]